MTGTNSGDVGQQGVLLTLGSPYVAPTPLTPATREEAAAEITDLDISEIVVGPEFPTVPIWSPHGQALAVVWVEWLLGQAPQQSHDAYISYIWKNLPTASDIASGHVRQMPGLPPP
jgi:hypothetical protein